jgi:hypothetical protein
MIEKIKTLFKIQFFSSSEWCEPFENVSSNYFRGQNFFHKCCTYAVGFLHEHTQCAFLDYYVGKKNTHTNHIGIFSCSREQFENVF